MPRSVALRVKFANTIKEQKVELQTESEENGSSGNSEVLRLQLP